MSRNINCTPDSDPILCVNEKSSNSSKSKESVKEKKKIRELFSRDLNKSILKLCSDADLRMKVLLSNTVSGVTSSSSKFSLKENSSVFGTNNKPSSLDCASSLSKSISLDTTKHSSKKIVKRKGSTYHEDISGSYHFNTEIDTIDDQTNKQLTIVKILKLQELARKMEERQNAVIKNKFESTTFEKSYSNGLEEGFRYGYFDNPNEGLNTQSEITAKTGDTTYNDYDKVILKSSEIQLLENKESARMRGGYQDPQQQKIHLKKKFDTDIPSPTNKTESNIDISKSLNDLIPSGLTITHEYPTKCVQDVNIQAFNRKYGIADNEDKLKQTSELGLSVKNLTDVDRGGQYLQYFEKMLNSVGEDFAKGFRAGFGDGFVAANIFLPVDTTFTEDEKEYISQMRKVLKFSDEDLNNDIKKMVSRAKQMKKNLNIPIDEFEDISNLIKKGVAKNIPLKFSKKDYKYYTDVSRRHKENVKTKSTYEDDSDLNFTAYETERSYVPQHTKSRATTYLTNHKINEFFQFLGSHLVATKPEDPISFLISLLEKCIEYRFNEFVIPAPLLYTKKHVESLYFVMDPMLTGYIDLNQYVHGMEALGIREMGDLANFRPGEKIDKYIFVTNACRHLLGQFREMIAMDTVTALPSKVTYSNVEAD